MTFGCTSFSWDTLDNKHLLGRTYDQPGTLENNRIAVVPRGYTMKLEIREDSQITAVSKYAFLGMAITGFPSPVMVDGLNEHGLMGALLNYPGYAVYDTQKDDSHINIHPGFFVGYLLSQCASVEEIASALGKLNLTGEKIMGQDMTVHYIFSDATGEAVIIEPDVEGIHIHRNTIGVMANSPDYLWHRTNLRNYISVGNLHSVSRPHHNLDLQPLGESQGGGFGLPGDYSSPSRFVRLATLKHFAVKGKDEVDGISRMFHTLACVDTPDGIVKLIPDGQGSDAYEQTLCIDAMCAESRTYYFSTASNRRISAIRLMPEIENTTIKYFNLQETQDIAYLN